MSIQLIQRYYKEVDDLIQYGGSNIETVISHKFGELIAAYCNKKNLKLVPQLDYKTKNGKLVRPDGTIKNALSLSFGYWESKANVNLDEEIRKKFNAGYPKNNILFEDSKTAILFQEGEEVKRVKIDNHKELDKILTLFINFEHAEYKSFIEAIEKFKQDIPQVVKALQEMIDKQQTDNAVFKQKRDDFLLLCKNSINPTITIENVNEMLIQHILTEEIFMAVFSDTQFIRENNIARELYQVEETFFTGSTKRQTLDLIKNYYEMIKHAASGIADHHEKQTFLKVIYENFYKAYNPKGADKLGIVYTPNQIVKFQIESVDYLLHKHFGKTLASENVEILDPATGTGTYICEMIEFIDKRNLPYKFKNEIHANEVSILPYYIANLNIEYTFRQKMGYYEEFKNICFVDTLDNVSALNYAGKMGNVYGFSTENAERIKQQNQRKISVIIGNPPYNASQTNENDNNKNREYKEVDKRIKDTYVKYSTAQKSKVYDMYARFFRWATDRINEDGIVCFITNRSFIDSRTFDGFRKTMKDEFDYLYIYDLKGDIRAKNDKTMQTGNVFGIMTGVAISFLIKTKSTQKKNCRIFYTEISDQYNKNEKLDILHATKFSELNFDIIEPDKNNNWINLAENNDWEKLIQLVSKNKDDKTIGKFYTNSIKTNRDEWVYDFKETNLINKIKYFIDKYNSEIDKLKKYKSIPEINNLLDYSIKWSRDLKNELLRKRKRRFFKTKILISNWRPFIKKYYYSEFILSDVLTKNHYQIFGNKLNNNNLIINFCDKNSNKTFHTLITNLPSDYHFTCDSISFSLYTYDEKNNRHDNITNWGLEQFRKNYELKIMNYEFKNEDEKFIIHNSKFIIQKESIFHYVYAVLHNPNYRKKYEQNLKREFPRIPFYTDFWKWANWGKELMELHINYETVDNYELRIMNYEFTNEGKKEKFIIHNSKFIIQNNDFIPKAKLKADKEAGEIIIDEITTLTEIPKIAWEYKLGTRSALEWVLDQYKESEPSDATIREMFNTYKFADYKEQVIDLLQKVCTVSVRTMEIVNEMEKENN